MATKGAQGRVWRAFEANEITHSGAHYLLAIAAASRAEEAPRASDVARELGVSRAAVSLQLRALAQHGFVRTDAHQRIHLTRLGADLVARVLSKREVVRAFLREILGVRPATAEADACKIEHLLSEETGAAVVRLLRFLQSAHPAARKCLDAFSTAASVCPPDGHCGTCAGACLMHAGGRPARRRVRRAERPLVARRRGPRASGREPRSGRQERH